MKYICLFSLLFLTGCASMLGGKPVVGPISGLEYSVIPTVQNFDDPDRCYANYGNIISHNNMVSQQYKNECRQHAVNKHPEWGEKYRNAVLNGEIIIGMNKMQARASWGLPKDVNRSVYSTGTREQWVYDEYDTYVYFRNGKLTSWQD